MKKIILLMKYPEKGKVKTRLASMIGDSLSLRLYISFVKDTIAIIKKSKIDFVISLDPFSKKNSLSSRFKIKQKKIIKQRGQSLDQKIINSFKYVIDHDPNKEKIIIIGSDSPDLPISYISSSFKILSKKDVVIGPSKDGGFYLIGIKRRVFEEKIFKNIPWSTEDVTSRVSQNLDSMNLSYGHLPQWSDIDTSADLISLLYSKNKHFLKKSCSIKILKSIYKYKRGLND